jgi:hypothetical protein
MTKMRSPCLRQGVDNPQPCFPRRVQESTSLVTGGTSGDMGEENKNLMLALLKQVGLGGRSKQLLNGYSRWV